MSAYRELWAHRDLLILLVGRNLKLRYKQTSLGFFWSLLGPLFQIVIYKIFLGILKVEVTIESLVTGIFMWQFLATTVGDSLTVIVGHATLIKKTPFPRIVLPLSTALANFVNFALSVVVLVVFLSFFDPKPHAIWLIPILLASHFALCLGMGLLVSSCNVFFRDIEHLVSAGMMAWFFMSPAIYDIETFVARQLGEGVVPLYLLNPMASLLASYRMVFLGMNETLFPVFLIPGFALCWIIFLTGLKVFHRLDGRFSDVL